MIEEIESKVKEVLDFSTGSQRIEWARQLYAQFTEQAGMS